MRNKILILWAGLLLAVLPAIAQQTPGRGLVGVGPASTPQAPDPRPLVGPGMAHTPGRDPVGENLFPPELVMSHQKAIGLEDAQKTSIRSEILKTQTRFTELQWQLQDAMETLVYLLRKDTVDEPQVLAELDKVLNFEREIKRTQLGLAVRIKNKLTPEQQARLRQLRTERAPRAAIAPPAPPAEPAPPAIPTTH